MWTVLLGFVTGSGDVTGVVGFRMADRITPERATMVSVDMPAYGLFSLEADDTCRCISWAVDTLGVDGVVDDPIDKRVLAAPTVGGAGLTMRLGVTLEDLPATGC